MSRTDPPWSPEWAPLSRSEADRRKVRTERLSDLEAWEADQPDRADVEER